jgi:hypothetical protein
MAFESAGLHSLHEVLTRFSFRVPDYQRGYAWQEPQWKAFWDDLEAALAHKRPHFLGTLMISRSEAQVETDVDVVDGQQRLATAIIAVNAIGACLGRSAEAYRFAYVDREKEQNHFLQYGLRQNVQSHALTAPSSYALNIKSAAAYFNGRCDALMQSKEQMLGELHEAILHQARLFVLSVHQDFDIHIAFETLNNRGRSLSAMELLKNRLMYLSERFEEPGDLRRKIHEAWKGIYTWLGRSPHTQGQDDEFLRAHTTVIYGAEREADWWRKRLFNAMFSSENAGLLKSDIERYIDSLEKAAGWWAHIHASEDLPLGHQKHLARLGHSGFAYFKPLILAAFLRLGRDRSEIVACPREHDIILEPLERLLSEIERYIVVVFRLANNKASLGRADVDGCARDLLAVSSDLEGVNLSAVGAREAVEFVADYIRAAVDNRVIEDTNRYRDSRFDWDGHVWPENCVQAVDRRMRADKQPGYYNWDFTRLVLFDYEESFRGDGAGAAKVSWESIKFDETVEHIYPQTPADVDYWRQKFPIDGRSDRRGRLSGVITNSLGNLLLLSRGANSEIQNHAFRDNLKPQKIDRFKNASFSGTEVVDVFRDWNLEAMAARGVALLKFAERRWRIALSDQPDNLESYLPLCFGSDAASAIVKQAGVKFRRATFAKFLNRLLEEQDKRF